MHRLLRSSPGARRLAVPIVAACLLSSVLLAGPAHAATGPALRQTFTGAPGFPELGGPGEVLSIDAATTSAPGGTDTSTRLDDLVIEETSPNQIAWLAEDSAPFNGSTLRVEAPAPFAWEPGSGSVSVVRADDPTTPCGSLRAALTVTSAEISVAFDRADSANRCLVRVSGIDVIPTAWRPLVSEALLLNSGSAPGIPSLLGVLALTSSAGSSPAIRLSSTPATTTCCTGGTTFVVAFAADGANRTVRLEQSLDRLHWTSAGTNRTDGSGRVSIGMLPRFNRYYRVAFVGDPPLAAGTSNVVRVLVRFRAAQSPAHASPVAIRAGTRLTFTTKVSPVVSYFPAPRVEFRLYHRSASTGAWTLSMTRVVTASSAGRATWAVRIAGRGDWYVRSRALSTVANAGSVFSSLARYRVE